MLSFEGAQFLLAITIRILTVLDLVEIRARFLQLMTPFAEMSGAPAEPH
jgi:hypothetical protein